MARERYRSNESVEAFDTTLMYDDVERIREREEEAERNENDKLSFAGMMALVAGISMVAVGLLGYLIPSDIIQLLQTALPVVGFGALGYGFYKILKLAFRKKELEFPTLNVYRKTKQKARPASNAASEGATRTRTRARTTSQTSTDPREAYRTRTYRRRTRTTTSKQKKTLSRSRINRVFSGVAGGLAEYTGVSANLIRFGFIISMFMTAGFPVIFIYLLLSIILPPDYDSNYFDNNKGGGGNDPYSGFGGGNSGQRREIRIR
jgi:phage shock protein PspC (stress-responsive transcriptional regulator)